MAGRGEADRRRRRAVESGGGKRRRPPALVHPFERPMRRLCYLLAFTQQRGLSRLGCQIWTGRLWGDVAAPEGATPVREGGAEVVDAVPAPAYSNRLPSPPIHFQIIPSPLLRRPELLRIQTQVQLTVSGSVVVRTGTPLGCGCTPFAHAQTSRSTVETRGSPCHAARSFSCQGHGWVSLCRCLPC